MRKTSAAAGRDPTVRGLGVPEVATSHSTRPSVLPFVIRALPRAPGLLVALCRSLCALPVCALTAIPSSISLCPLLAPRARPLLPRPRTVGDSTLCHRDKHRWESLFLHVAERGWPWCESCRFAFFLRISETPRGPSICWPTAALARALWAILRAF